MLFADANADAGWVALLITAITSTIAAIATAYFKRQGDRDKLQNDKKFVVMEEQNNAMAADLAEMKAKLAHCEQQHQASDEDRKQLWTRLEESQADRERLWSLLTKRETQ